MSGTPVHFLLFGTVDGTFVHTSSVDGNLSDICCSTFEICVQTASILYTYTFPIFITIWTQIPSHYRTYSVCFCVQSVIILHTLTFLSVYPVWTQLPNHTRSFQKVFCVQTFSILYTIVFSLISLFWTQIRCLGILKLGGICVHRCSIQYTGKSLPFSTIWTQILSHNWLTFLCICVQLVSIFYTRMFLLFIVNWTQFCSLSMVKPRAFCVQTVSIQYTCQNSFPFSQVWTQLFLDTTLSCSQVPSDLKPRNPYYLCASAYYPLLVIYVVSAIWHGCYDIQNTLLGIFSIFLSSREDANVLLFLLLQLNSTSTNIRNGCPYA